MDISCKYYWLECRDFISRNNPKAIQFGKKITRNLKKFMSNWLIFCKKTLEQVYQTSCSIWTCYRLQKDKSNRDFKLCCIWLFWFAYIAPLETKSYVAFWHSLKKPSRNWWWLLRKVHFKKKNRIKEILK